jgi:hypothetical protein
MKEIKVRIMLYTRMTVKTLLGSLVKQQPHYMNLLMKSHNYEEIFTMNKWIGLIEFTKKTGTKGDAYHKYISSFITIQDEHTIYQEKIEHFLVPTAFHPIIVHSTWKKNNVKILSRGIPSSIFQSLEKKRPINIIYSSHPL